MDQQKDEAAPGSSAAKVGGAVSDLAAQTQQKIKEAKPLFDDLRTSVGDKMDKASDLARKASDVGFQAVTQASDVIQGAAREVGSRAYQQGARAQGYLAEFVTEQPLAALLIAGIIGYGLGYLMLRRSA